MDASRPSTKLSTKIAEAAHKSAEATDAWAEASGESLERYSGPAFFQQLEGQFTKLDKDEEGEGDRAQTASNMLEAGAESTEERSGLAEAVSRLKI